MKALVRLEGIAKRYPRIHTGRDRWRALASLFLGRGDYPHRVVLEGIDLEVKQGHSLGIVGENGAGKSTLLKIVAGVVKPSSGKVWVQGRVGALLELGAGFHPEYTGRENILLAASLMGLGIREIKEKLPAIIEFADIGDDIDEPLKHYSSGMVVRLGFAVVTALAPDVLITDEILAVGDESFQKKCIRWIEAYVEEGGTLLLCSHSMFHIQKLCKEACWIHQGRMFRHGDAFEVTQAYLAYHERKTRGEEASSRPCAADVYRLEELWLDQEGGDVTVWGRLYSPDGRPPVVLVGIVRADGTPVYGVTSDHDGFVPNPLSAHRFGFCLHFPSPPLLPGEYVVRGHAMDPEGLRLFDTLEKPFRIQGKTRELGFCRLVHAWRPLSREKGLD